jgi:hypothetical protein
MAFWDREEEDMGGMVRGKSGHCLDGGVDVGYSTGACNVVGASKYDRMGYWWVRRDCGEVSRWKKNNIWGTKEGIRVFDESPRSVGSDWDEAIVGKTNECADVYVRGSLGRAHDVVRRNSSDSSQAFLTTSTSSI